MTNEEKLLLAMGEIDDELISEASSAYKRRFTPLTRRLSVAASVVLVSAAVLAASELFLPKAFDTGFDGGNASPPFSESTENSGCPDGTEFLESEYGRIYNLRSIGDDKISFNLSLHSDCDTALDIYFYGINESGMQELVATTDKSSEIYGYTFPPVITVDGVIAEELPNTVGDYSVTIDFANISYAYSGVIINIQISSFGPVYTRPF